MEFLLNRSMITNIWLDNKLTVKTLIEAQADWSFWGFISLTDGGDCDSAQTCSYSAILRICFH